MKSGTDQQQQSKTLQKTGKFPEEFEQLQSEPASQKSLLKSVLLPSSWRIATFQSDKINWVLGKLDHAVVQYIKLVPSKWESERIDQSEDLLLEKVLQ